MLKRSAFYCTLLTLIFSKAASAFQCFEQGKDYAAISLETQFQLKDLKTKYGELPLQYDGTCYAHAFSWGIKTALFRIDGTDQLPFAEILATRYKITDKTRIQNFNTYTEARRRGKKPHPFLYGGATLDFIDFLKTQKSIPEYRQDLGKSYIETLLKDHKLNQDSHISDKEIVLEFNEALLLREILSKNKSSPEYQKALADNKTKLIDLTLKREKFEMDFQKNYTLIELTYMAWLKQMSALKAPAVNLTNVEYKYLSHAANRNPVQLKSSHLNLLKKALCLGIPLVAGYKESNGNHAVILYKAEERNDKLLFHFVDSRNIESMKILSEDQLSDVLHFVWIGNRDTEWPLWTERDDKALYKSHLKLSENGLLTTYKTP